MSWLNKYDVPMRTLDIRAQIDTYLDKRLPETVFIQLANVVPLFLNDSARMNALLDKYYDDLIPEIRANIFKYTSDPEFEHELKDHIKEKVQAYLDTCSARITKCEYTVAKLEHKIQMYEYTGILAAGVCVIGYFIFRY